MIIKILKIIAIGTGVIGGAAVLFIIGALSLASYHADQNKKYLEKSFNTVKLPPSMRLSQSNWTGMNIDTADYWSYDYTTDNAKQSINELQEAAQQAGYSIRKSSLDTEVAEYVATNEKLDTRFTYSAGSNDTVGIMVFRASLNRDYP